MGFTSKLPSSLARAIVVLSQVLLAGTSVAGAAEGDPGIADSSSPRTQGLRSLTVRLAWHDAYKVLPNGYKTMSREVNRVFREHAVKIEWEKGSPRVLQGVDADPLRINVVLLPSSSSSWGLHRRVMGVATHREGAKGGIYIFYPELLRTLNLDRSIEGLRSPRAILELARAIARVVAHELVHVMAPHHPHTETGLMHAKLTRRFLRRRRVHLDRASALVFRDTIRATLDEALAVSAPKPAEEKIGEPGG